MVRRLAENGRTLATGSADAKLWEYRTLQERFTLEGNSSYIASLTFNSDGKLLAAGTGGIDFRDQPVPGVIMLWESAEGQ